MCLDVVTSPVVVHVLPEAISQLVSFSQNISVYSVVFIFHCLVKS